MFPSSFENFISSPLLPIEKFHCSLKLFVKVPFNCGDIPITKSQNIPCSLEINNYASLFPRTPGRPRQLHISVHFLSISEFSRPVLRTTVRNQLKKKIISQLTVEILTNFGPLLVKPDPYHELGTKENKSCCEASGTY